MKVTAKSNVADVGCTLNSLFAIANGEYGLLGLSCCNRVDCFTVAMTRGKDIVTMPS